MKTPTARKLPSGSWFVRVMVNGESINITKPTEKEAIAEAMAIKAGMKKAAQSEESAMPLSKAYERYIDARSGALSPSTIAGYKKLARNTFQPLMTLPLDRITNERIQREISAMAKDGKSPKYIRNAEGLLSSVLREYLPDFRMNVYMPQKEKIEPRRITEDEIKAILTAAKGTEIELPILMGLWMGMRLSEIRGAMFQDIKDGRLHVCRAIVEDEEGNATAKPPKTFSGDRWVAIPAYVQSLIDAIPDKSGSIVNLTGKAIYHRFTRMCEKHGIEHCRFHDLRHANAAVMIRLGIDSKYAQERNGWSTDRMYKQVYAYTMDDKMSEIDREINAYFEDNFVMDFVTA